jgi:hypothetical protein
MEGFVIGAIICACVIGSNFCMYKKGFCEGYRKCVKDTCDFLNKDWSEMEGREDNEED